LGNDDADCAVGFLNKKNQAAAIITMLNEIVKIVKRDFFTMSFSSPA